MISWQIDKTASDKCRTFVDEINAFGASDLVIGMCVAVSLDWHANEQNRDFNKKHDVFGK